MNQRLTVLCPPPRPSDAAHHLPCQPPVLSGPEPVAGTLVVTRSAVFFFLHRRPLPRRPPARWTATSPCSPLRTLPPELPALMACLGLRTGPA